MRNDFTRSLLNYSAERDDCIGRPERWGNPPPLLVETTPLHEEMESLADELWAEPQRMVWYFLVGGPGNGKSEAVGKLVRRLNRKAAAAGLQPIFDPAQGSHGGSIKYDFEGTLPHRKMWLLQDVSVPMSKGSDPAADLLASLELCAEGSLHLLACANRGMLLRATRTARKDPAKASLAALLEKIDAASREDSTAPQARWVQNCNGKEIEVRVWPLDHESVLFGQGNATNPWADPTGSLFDQVIQKAVATENWEQKGCSECRAHDSCPMYGDAIWLRDAQRRRGTLAILRNAEIWSGQRIVLREALGLVSAVLVGCPSDFVDGATELHPCDWVNNRLSGTPPKPKDQQSLLELVSHRIYQDLFGRPTPTGLALDRFHQARDEWVITALAMLPSIGVVMQDAIKRLDSSFPKQAGPLRLVSHDGILQPLDPSKDVAWCSKHNLLPDGTISELRNLGGTYGLEQHLGAMFLDLENGARNLDPHKDPARAFAALYRWASTLYLRCAGTACGETPNSDTLTDYLGLLQQPTRPIQAAEGQTTLRELMKAAAESGPKVEMAPSIVAELPSLQLKPLGARPRNANPRWPANDRLSLQVSSGATAGPSVLLTATTFLDTWRKQALHVAEWNISPAMENLMRAWRDDFIVSQGQFRNLQALDYSGTPALEFEFISPTTIQVRLL